MPEINSEDYYVCAVVRPWQKIRKHTRLDPVVRIDEKYPFAVCGLKPCFSRFAYAAVLFFMNNLNSSVLFRQSVTYLPAVIGRAVIHQNNLEIGEILICNAVNAIFKITAHIINRNYDAYFNAVHLSPCLKLCKGLCIARFYLGNNPALHIGKPGVIPLYRQQHYFHIL